MVLKKEEVVSEFYVAKAVLRSTCLKKCLSFKEETPILSSTESNCLQNCGAKIRDYLELSRDQYLKTQKTE